MKVRLSFLNAVRPLAAVAMLVLGTAAPAQPRPAAQPPPARSVEIAEDGTALTHEAAPPTTGTLQLLRSLEARHGAAGTFQGTFKQSKVSQVFLEETASAGRFWFRKPALFRTDYDRPDELTNLVVQDAIYVYTPAIKQVEIYRFKSDEERDQQLHSMAIGLGFRAEDIAREYEVLSSADAPAALAEVKAEKLDPAKVALIDLTPRPELRETSPFTRLKLWIDKETLLPQRIWFEDYNGDKTTITILKIDVNATLDDALFRPKFPPGTEVIDKTQS